MNEKYTPKEQKAIAALHQRYESEVETPLQKAQRIDQASRHRILIATLFFAMTAIIMATLGISSCLLWHVRLLPLGCAIGACGLTLCCMIPYIYKRMKKAERDRVAPQIIELLNQI